MAYMRGQKDHRVEADAEQSRIMSTILPDDMYIPQGPPEAIASTMDLTRAPSCAGELHPNPKQ